jgi:hypothetical protein
VDAGHTVTAMTDRDEPAARRHFTNSPRAHGNRIFYSLVIAWPIWFFVARRPSDWLILPIAAAVWLAFTVVLTLIDRRRWERENS